MARRDKYSPEQLEQIQKCQSKKNARQKKKRRMNKIRLAKKAG